MIAAAAPPRRRWRAVLLAALTIVLALLLPALPASAAALPAVETRVGASGPATAVVVGVHECITAGQRPVRGPSQLQIVVGNCVAAEAGTTGGAAAVRLGQAGEDAVRGAYDIGPKFTANVGGRTRIFDGLSNEAVSEVKNVGSQAYTQQLKDSLGYAQGNGLRFDLYVRPDTYLTGPLRDAISGGSINLRYIP